MCDYYVVSPNVWNDGEDYSAEMLKNRIAAVGWEKDTKKGMQFESIKKGDCIIVAKRNDWQWTYYFMGIVEGNEKKPSIGRISKRLSHIVDLNEIDLKFSEWSANGSTQIPSPQRITKDDNLNVIKMIDKKLKEGFMKERIKEFTKLLKNTHNFILHGAPGTGKTYLANKIAEQMIFGDGKKHTSDEDKKLFKEHTGFVQFHPSYDYTDFVEGLRPVNGENNGQIGFERKDGVFKAFCKRALEKSKIDGIDNFAEIWDKLIEKLNEINFIKVPLLSGRDEMKIELNEYGDGLTNRTYENDDYEKGNWIRGQSKFFTKEQCYNIYRGLPGIPSGGHDNYRKAIVKYMKDEMGLQDYKEGTVISTIKPFIFIIDEINRGELSKIFGELFFSIDPGYRGTEGRGQTQYQNLVEAGDVFYEGFYVPENVYIIGTMNDIDRSVESMDLAMRRRFSFKEITADDSAEEMLTPGNLPNLSIDDIDEIKARMGRLNAAIISDDIGLSSSYQVGAAYFLKYTMYTDELDSFVSLWEYNLEPLLREYLRGQAGMEDKMEKLKAAYDGDGASVTSAAN